MAATHPSQARSAVDLPLRLFEVLERELASLKGDVPSTMTWLLREDDVDLPAMRAALLRPARTKQGQAIQQVAQALTDMGLKLEQDQSELDLLAAVNLLIAIDREMYWSYLLDEDSETRQIAERIRPQASQPSQRPLQEISANEDLRTQLLAAAANRNPPASVKRNRLLLEAVFSCSIVARIDDVRLQAFYDRVQGVGAEGSQSLALCLSGGGIRSASYALGVLQGLAAAGILSKVDYLSTVSGGGYIGGWLTSWINRHPDGVAGVVGELADSARQEAQSATRRVHPDADPLRFLRSYSHYLNPRGGLFTLDTWTWVGIYLRNLLLSWIILVPLLLILVAVPRVYGSLLYDTGLAHGDVFPLLIWLASISVVLTIVSATINRPSLSDPGRVQEVGAWTRSTLRLRQALKQPRWVVVLGVAPMCVFAVLTSLVFWGLTRSKQPFTGEQVWALFSHTDVRNWVYLIPYVAVEHVLIWGEALVLIAWLVATAILGPLDLKRRLQELVVMLLAGVPTWGILSLLATSAIAVSSGAWSGFELGKAHVLPEHLYVIGAVPIALGAVLVGMTLFIGFVSRAAWIDDEDREWWARFGSCILIFMVGWATLSTIALLGPSLLQQSPAMLAGIGGLSGLIALIAGGSAVTSSSASSGANTASIVRNVAASLGLKTLALASLVFFAVLLSALSLVVSFGIASMSLIPKETIFQLANIQPLKAACGRGELLPDFDTGPMFSDPEFHLSVLCQTPLSTICMTIIALVAVVLVASLLINVNKFSLHAAYRLRIVRAFLGASRADARRPNPFTGFDPFDNLQMHELRAGLLREGDFVDLPALVQVLRKGMGDSTAPFAWLASRLCAADVDKSGVLKSRLTKALPDRAILSSLQRSILQCLNRMLEGDRLQDVDELMRTLCEKDVDESRKLVERGEHVFANRFLLEHSMPGVFRPCHIPPPPPHRYLHIVNLTLNLVRGKSLSWQERKAAPFAVTAMHCGSYYLGFRDSRTYGGDEGISLGTAVAVSGAAVSPNMGYTSSPITALLLTFFNVRLGWWLGNPGVAGAETYTRSGPRLSFKSIISEALGLTDDRSPYIYLSDGGHFDNLGLFEVVLRRCRLIIVSDAGADPNYEFEDVGNAVRKIQIDLGVPIEFQNLTVRKFEGGAPNTDGKYCAIARVRYSAVDGPTASDGILVLLKPTLVGSESMDILNYHAQNSLFPQEPTSDQFFGEAQFESYRKLGERESRVVFGGFHVTDDPTQHFADLVRSVCDYLDPDSTWTKQVRGVAARVAAPVPAPTDG